MAYLKAIPNKKSGRLLVAVRNNLLKELKFEAWLLLHHPEYYDQDVFNALTKKISKLEKRIQRAVDKDRLKERLQLEIL